MSCHVRTSRTCVRNQALLTRKHSKLTS
uniref:Uncharacterized protein n=1 Tax=Anguilla anguilla TaxID=7936 RepID=A0A0E9XN22_ANGAN